MQNIFNDLKFAVRQLRRSPGFALTAILTLALGIGANTAIFSLLDQALLRSLPVHNPAELTLLTVSNNVWSGSSSSSGGDDKDYFSYPMYHDLSVQNRVFSGILATVPAGAGFVRNNSSQVVQAELVSGNYFDVLGVQPALGRLLNQSDDAALDSNPVAVLSYDFWRNNLAADPSIINSTVTLNGHPFQILGVGPPAFHSAVWGQTPSVFVPISMMNQVTSHTSLLTKHDARWLTLIARRKPGVTLAEAQVGIAPLFHALHQHDLELMGTKSPRFTQQWLSGQLLLSSGARGYSYIRGNIEKPFLALMAMAFLVLLIASVNVASLLLVRSAGRMREFSLRAALGASRARILTLLLLEGLLIGVVGGTLGLLLAPSGIRVLVAYLDNPDSQNPLSTSLDLRLLAFNFAIAIAVALFFSQAPAMQLRRLDLVTNLRESSSTGSGSLLTLRRVVVCLQIGLSVVLLVGSGLFLRSMHKLRAVDVGFQTAQLLSFDLDPTLAGYKNAQMPALHQRLLTALSAIPGVQAVTATDDAELANNHETNNVTVAGYIEPPDSSFTVETAGVAPNYFATMGMPLLAGRSLSEHDTIDHPAVAVVNQAFVKHFCSGSSQSCIGRQMAVGAGDKIKLDTEIVGVVRDAHHGGIREDVRAAWFRPIAQRPDTGDLNFYLRYRGAETPILSSVRSALHGVDPGLSPTGVRTMEEQVDQDLINERLIAVLATAFGILATLLAGVGLYGVLAYSTAQRTREIGIRMALGSTRIEVATLILKSVLSLAALGVVIAIPIAYGLSVLIRSQLFGVSAADPIILLGVVALIATVAFLSAIIPARRAATISPTVALRTE